MVALPILKVVGKFVMDNRQIIALVVVVIGAYLYWNNLVTTVDDQKTRIEKLVKENAATTAKCTSDKTLLMSQINSQNAAITSFQEQTAVNQYKLDQAKTAISELQRKYARDVRNIVIQPKPKDCSEAIKYLVDAVPELTDEPGDNK